MFNQAGEFPSPGKPGSQEYYSEFECTPAQYHAAIDKLWEALGVTGPQEDDCFTMAAREIVRIRSRVKELEEVVKDQRRQISEKCDECAAMAHVIIESGFVPGVDSACRCGECQQVAKGMADAGYMSAISDDWWGDATDE